MTTHGTAPSSPSKCTSNTTTPALRWCTLPRTRTYESPWLTAATWPWPSFLRDKTPASTWNESPPRDADFRDVAFTDRERALLPATDPTGEHATRFWCAKEAVAKARRKGLGGNPKRFVITEVDGPRLRADGLWVDTEVIGDHLVAWTAVVRS